MNREPPIYIPPPEKPKARPWIVDSLAVIGAIALVCGMIFVCVEFAFMLECVFKGKCQ